MKNQNFFRHTVINPKEKFLIEIDEKLNYFANSNKLKLTKNYQDWPERSLFWKYKGLKRQVQIYLLNEKDDDFAILASAYSDFLFSRIWWKSDIYILKSPFNWNKLEQQITELIAKVSTIKRSQLKQ